MHRLMLGISTLTTLYNIITLSATAKKNFDLGAEGISAVFPCFFTYIQCRRGLFIRFGCRRRKYTLLRYCGIAIPKYGIKKRI